MAYLYVMAWGKYVGRPQQEIEGLLALAHKENAPERALWPRGDGTWVTLEELHDAEDRKAVQAIVDGYKNKSGQAAQAAKDTKMEYGEYAQREFEFYTSQVEWYRKALERQNALIKTSNDTLKAMRKVYGPESREVEEGAKFREQLYRRRKAILKAIENDTAWAEKFRKEAEEWKSRK